MKSVIRIFLPLIISPTITHAAISWNITYADVTLGTNSGFNDPVEGETRRATFEAVTNYISNTFDGTGTINFTVQESYTDSNTLTLASAGTSYYTSPNGFTDGFLYTQANTGTIPGQHGYAIFNFGYNWNSGMTVPTNSQIDLFTVALHELSHALGFSSLISSDGKSNISGNNPGVYSTYDSYLEMGDGTPLVNSDNGATFTATVSNLTSGDIYFNGPNATAANGGNPVKIHAPDPFQEGSSLSHIDSSIDAVMNPTISNGKQKREFTEIELGMFQDIGWTVIPEPSSIALLGLISLAGLQRRRN